MEEVSAVPEESTRKAGFTSFTLSLSEADRESLEALSRLLGTTRAGALRRAVRTLRYLEEAQQKQKKELALVDTKGKVVIIHIV